MPQLLQQLLTWKVRNLLVGESPTQLQDRLQLGLQHLVQYTLPPSHTWWALIRKTLQLERTVSVYKWAARWAEKNLEESYKMASDAVKMSCQVSAELFTTI